MKILIGYYSRTGHTRKMAEAISEGVRKSGLDVTVKRVNDIKPSELLNYQAIIFGSPTYYGLMAAEMKKLLDDSVGYHGRLAGKVCGAFTSSGGIGCGSETTILRILETFLIHGMIVVGEADIYHYGPVAIGMPNRGVLKSCVKYGEKIARLTKKIFEK